MAELYIGSLGAQGDGLATSDGGPVHVPYTLPGERVEADVTGDRGALVRVLDPSPDRHAPLCRHFGDCGGCALQHLRAEPYHAWKQQQVVRAFAARGLTPEIAQVVPTAPGTRRRAVLTARRRGAIIDLGYHRRLGREVIDIGECPVLRPVIMQALPPLRGIVKILLAGRSEARLTILETETGLDVLIEGIPEPSEHRTRAAITALAAQAGLARLTVAGELISQLHAPRLRFGGTLVVPPPGAFVQAVAGAEQELTARVLAACEGAKRVADLFCGVGAFSLPLARKAHVESYELEPDLLDALKSAAAGAGGLKKLTTERRDLFREPLTPRELARFDAVVFDPPRAGAKTQAKEMAASSVPVIVAVSCNPATLARDVRTLVDGGYALGALEPVDQFLYSPHVEAVAVLTRDAKR